LAIVLWIVSLGGELLVATKWGRLPTRTPAEESAG